MDSKIYSDNFFILAQRLLTERDRKWKIRDFEDDEVESYYVSPIFQVLEQEGILLRESDLGCASFSRLKNPKKLYQFCIEHFVSPDMKSVSFRSDRNTKDLYDELVHLGFDLFLGGMGGVAPQYASVISPEVTFYCLNRDFFKIKNLKTIEFQLAMYRVKQGAQIKIIFPKYKKLIRYQEQKKEGFRIPSDFFTALDLSRSKNPMAQTQLANIYKGIKMTEGSFGYGIV